MSKSIGKRLRGDYAPMPIENNFNKNRRVNYFELFGKNEQSYIEPTPTWGQSLYQERNMSYIPQERRNTEYFPSRFEKFVRKLKSPEVEGTGYEDNLAKIDQRTNTGIIQPTLNRFLRAHPRYRETFPDDIKDLTQHHIDIIYKNDYYDAYRINEIQNEKLAETMFDSYVNHSPKDITKWLQEGINLYSHNTVSEDGILGSQTINSLNYIDENTVALINNYVLEKRIEDAKQKRPNYRGLIPRINRLRME